MHVPTALCLVVLLLGPAAASASPAARRQALAARQGETFVGTCVGPSVSDGEFACEVDLPFQNPVTGGAGFTDTVDCIIGQTCDLNEPDQCFVTGCTSQGCDFGAICGQG
ncbi:hypothetical protein CLAIMM_09849 [Cladophialophora immunda]|nr:hypothetical protein CLAIMM_09849 [Cladophialophora immunda]